MVLLANCFLLIYILFVAILHKPPFCCPFPHRILCVFLDKSFVTPLFKYCLPYLCLHVCSLHFNLSIVFSYIYVIHCFLLANCLLCVLLAHCLFVFERPFVYSHSFLPSSNFCFWSSQYFLPHMLYSSFLHFPFAFSLLPSITIFLSPYAFVVYKWWFVFVSSPICVCGY